jgi:uncharacterized protein (TIGR00252 family)
MDARPALGRTGEDRAAQLYRSKGFTLVERNARRREGEIDLIARRGDVLVFCEVKTRRTDRWGTPAEQVGFKKQQRLRQLAALWLQENSPGRVQVRFDVVSVIVGQRDVYVTHIPDAF